MVQKDFKKLLGNILIYGLGNVSVKLVGLILLPYYTNTKLLSVNEYGGMGLLDISSQILIVIFSLSLYSAYARWYWDKEYTNRRKAIFFTCFSALSLLSVILALSGFLASDNISILLFESNAFSKAVMLMVIGSALQPLVDFTLTQMRVEEKAFSYISFNIFRLIVILGFTVFFLKFRKDGIASIYEAQLIGNLSFLLLSSPYIVKNSEISFSFPILKDILKFSTPLVLAALSNVLLVGFDRYVLNYKSTRLNVGIYVQGYKLANTTKIFLINSVQLALAPAIFKIMNRPDHKVIYSKIMTWFTIIVIYFSLFISLFGLEITKLFTTGKVYWDAYKLIPIFSLGITFGMLKDVSVTGLQIIKKTRMIGVFLAGVAVFNLLANMTLIPLLGIYGAALSSFISQLVFFLIMYAYSQKYYTIPYRLDKVFLIIISGSLLFLPGMFINEYQLGARILIKSLVLVLFPVVLLLLKVFDQSEIRLIKSLIPSFRERLPESEAEEVEEREIKRIDEAEL